MAGEEDQMLKIEASRLTAATALSRRHFLLGTAGVAGAAMLPRRLWAQATPHAFQHGEFEIMVVSDGHLVLPIGILAPDAPPEELAALIEAAGIGPDEFMPPTNPVLIRSGSEVILFDTGSGGEFQPETSGRLAENLSATGIAAESITKVVFTHAHPDHVYGTVMEAGLRYPNAVHYVAAAEWDFWMDPDLKSKMPEDMHAFVDGAQKHLSGVEDKLTMLNPGDDVVTGIRVLDTAGHTPGHISFEIAGDEGLILVGDAIAEPAVFFPHPDWRFGFDGIPDLAIEKRRALLDRAATDRVKMIGFHWPYPGVAYAERKNGGYVYAPAA